MTLTLNTHYKYDTFGRYYYLTPIGAELMTGIDSLDADWPNAERRLRSQGKIMKTIIAYSANLETRKRYRREDIVEYMLYKNDNGELDALLLMLGDMAEWAWDTDGDRITYEERNPFDMFNYLPMTIRQRGVQVGLIFFGQCVTPVPEDEYQVGY